MLSEIQCGIHTVKEFACVCAANRNRVHYLSLESVGRSEIQVDCEMLIECAVCPKCRSSFQLTISLHVTHFVVQFVEFNESILR